MKKLWLIPAILITVGASGFYAVNQVSAVTDQTNWHQTIIQRLARAFGKNETEVQSVFNQVRTDQQTEREAEYLAKITAAVKTGTITEAQKQLLMAKHAEMIKIRPEPGFQSDLTPAERRAEMDQRRTDLSAWAKQNNLPLDLLMGSFGRSGKNGLGMGRENLDGKGMNQR